MAVRVAVDFGTSSTCVVVSINGREPQVVVIDGQPLMSSAVYAGPDGTIFVGQEAERQAAVDPSRYEPNPKRRIDEGELLLGNHVIRVVDVIHAVLRRAVGEARRLAGGAPADLLVLTHPAEWGSVRTRLLREAGLRLARETSLVPEPVAAAVFHAAMFTAAELNQERTVVLTGQPGDTLAVLDLGGGTVDVSVVTRLPTGAANQGTNGGQAGFRVLATRGQPHWGGADVDQALLDHIGGMVSGTDPAAWKELVEGRELAARRRRRVLWQDVRDAKETLSRHAYADVPMPLPFPDAHVTRNDLERLIAEPLGKAVDLTIAAIREAGLKPAELTGIFLVGGSSRIPLVSRLTLERTGVLPILLDQPETVVARGALQAVLIKPTQPAPPRHAGPRPPGAAVSGLNVVRPGNGHTGTPSRFPPPSPPRGVPAAGTAAQPARRRRGKLPWLVGGVVLLAAAMVAALGIVWIGSLNREEGRVISQYDYRFYAPLDWEQTPGGSPSERKVFVKPSEAPIGKDLVVVQEYLNNYDATADRARLVNELRTAAEERAPQYSNFNGEAAFGGKTVIYYRETSGDLIVDWYVQVQRSVRVHVGCQYAGGVPEDRVRSACEQIVRTLEIIG